MTAMALLVPVLWGSLSPGSFIILSVLAFAGAQAELAPLAGGQMQPGHSRGPKSCFPIDAREANGTRHRII